MANPEPSFYKPAKAKINCILDSGAFSAWKLKKAIDFDAYCRYLKENDDWITTYINLDTIIPEDPNEAARLSFENLKRMRKQGLRPMAVYHVGEDISWLERMLDLGCDYIGLAGLSMRDDKTQQFYKYAWSHMVDRKGLPLVRVHGLGEGRETELRLFPWASTDSSSWFYSAHVTGQMTLPGGKSLSWRNDGRGSKSSPDVSSLQGTDKEAWETFIRLHHIDPAGFEASNIAALNLRTYITALYWQQLQEDVRARHPVKFVPRGFFNPKPYSGAIDVDFNLHLVSANNWYSYTALAMLKYPNQLFSYFGIAEGAASVHKGLRQYITNPKEYILNHPYCREHWDTLEKYIDA